MFADIAASAASTPPWWSIPAFTLAGGILGATVTQGFTVANERRKAKKEELVSNQALRSQAGSAGSDPCRLLILPDKSVVEK